MDRKNKVWLIVLIVLLVLAVAGMVVSRNQLTDKQAEFDAVNAQLTKAQEDTAALEAEVAHLTDSLADAQTTEVPTENTETPTETPAESTEAPADVQSLEAELAQTQSDLDAQRAAVTAAEAALDDRQTELDAANSSIAALEAQIAEMTVGADALADLEAQLEAARSERDAIAAELEAARAEYERRVAELEAYLLSRELVDGEAHVATTSVREISVSADGVTAACSYANTSVSGNAVVLTLVLDGEEIYRSEALQPGDAIETVTLSRALSAGEYEAIAVAAIYDADGSCLFSSRTPVALSVAAQ